MEEEERERMQFLVSNFTEDQLDRYAMYRRASFPKVGFSVEIILLFHVASYVLRTGLA